MQVTAQQHSTILTRMHIIILEQMQQEELDHDNKDREYRPLYMSSDDWRLTPTVM